MVDLANGGDLADELFSVAAGAAQHLDSNGNTAWQQHTLVHGAVASLAELLSEMACDRNDVCVGVSRCYKHLLHS
jgi:hypothetical protein